MTNDDLLYYAKEAGTAAAIAATPPLMTVIDRTTGESYAVSEGVCGFAWVRVPGNCAFGRWLRKQGLVSDKMGSEWTKAYEGGYQYWVWQFNQSMTRKEAYARAFANVLKANGVPAYMGSRLD